MNEKQFRVQEHCLRSSYGIEAENWLVTNDNHCIVLTNKSEAHMVANMLNDVIDVLNELNDEKDELKRNYDLCVHRRMNDHNEIHRLEKENKELKARCEDYRKLSIQYKQKYDGKISDNTFLENENKELKEEIIKWKSKYFDAMGTVIGEYSTNIKEDMEELEKEVWGDVE